MSFRSGGVECAGWWYEAAQGEGPRPVVVMGHGFSLTRHDRLEPYAEAFAAAGCHVLAFDYRWFGDSGGEPRQRFRIKAQQEDIRVAADFARAQPGVDPQRLVLWGFSFGGGHAATLLAGGVQACAGILLCPFADGARRVAKTSPLLSAWIAPRAIADLAGRGGTIPVTDVQGGRGALTGPGEAAGFSAVIQPGSPWRNEISAGEMLTLAMFRPVAKAARIKQPVWVGRCSGDETAPPAAIAKLADAIPLAELHEFRGNHFAPFLEPERDKIIESQVAFLRRTALA